MNSKNEGKMVLFLMIALIAFGFGSGIGISMGISGVDANKEVVKANTGANVTQEVLNANVPNNKELLADFDNDRTNVTNNSSHNNEQSVDNDYYYI